VTFNNEDDSLVVQNGGLSRQATHGPVQLTADPTQNHDYYCNLGHTTKINCVESKLRAPKYLDTSSTTSGLSQDQEATFSTLSSFYFLYAAKLHLICLAVLVRITFIVNYGFVFGEVRYIYFEPIMIGSCISHEVGLS
jgi:hypothetical protein